VRARARRATSISELGGTWRDGPGCADLASKAWELVGGMDGQSQKTGRFGTPRCGTRLQLWG
jgi:hypothetical protein